MFSDKKSVFHFYFVIFSQLSFCVFQVCHTPHAQRNLKFLIPSQMRNHTTSTLPACRSSSTSITIQFRLMRWNMKTVEASIVRSYTDGLSVWVTPDDAAIDTYIDVFKSMKWCINLSLLLKYWSTFGNLT